MKVRPHPLVLLAALVALLVAVPGASAAAESGTDAAKPAAATAQEEAPTAAERRAASSEFEREKLDPEAFGSEESAKDSDDAAASDSGGSILRFMFGLAVVLAVIFGVHWLLKQWGQSRLQGVAGRSGVIDVVATTSLAQGRSLHLVRVGSELVLVGATEQSITRIGEMDATSVGAMAADRGNGEFQAMLNGAMVAGQPGVPAGMGGTSSANQPFVKRFLENLRMSTAR